MRAKRERIDTFDVFCFAHRLGVYVFRSQPVVDGARRTAEALREVAAGEICLFDTPREASRKVFETHRQRMEEYVRRNIGKLIRRDRPGQSHVS